MMLKFNNLTNLVVRVYEGTTRDNALNPIVEFNGQPTDEYEYRVKWNSGLLVVAVPEANVDTDFEFAYWINQKEKQEEYSYTEQKWEEYKQTAKDFAAKAMDDTAIIVVSVIVCIFVIAFCAIICYVRCKADKKKETQL